MNRRRNVLQTIEDIFILVLKIYEIFGRAQDLGLYFLLTFSENLSGSGTESEKADQSVFKYVCRLIMIR